MNIDRPAFKPHLLVQPTEEGLILVSERGSSLLRGAVYSRLVGLVNGTNTLSQITSALEPVECSVDAVNRALATLEKSGYLTDGADDEITAEAVFWSSVGVDRTALAGVKKTAVDVINYTKIDLSAITTNLAAAGLALQQGSDLVVALVDDYLDERLADINRQCVEQKRCWIIAKPAGSIPWLGPIFEPGHGCWQCLANRLRMNRISHSDRNGGIPQGLSAVGVNIALNMLCVEAIKFIAQRRSDALSSNLLTLDLRSLRLENHAISRYPQCSVCGKPPTQKIEVKLEPRTNTGGENGYRSCTPEETLERLSKQVSPITGIISSVTRTNRRKGERESPIHSYVAWHRGSCGPRRHAGRTAAGFELAFGKGASDAQAKVSCLAEAIERYSCAYNDSDVRVAARFSDLEGAIHPDAILNFSEQQYKNRLSTNRDDDLFNWVPFPFDERQQIEWTAVWSLRDHSVKYLPSAYCFYYYPEHGKDRFCIANSNGCASGNTIEEAVLQGLLELVERDAAAVWWYNRLQLPEVNIDSFEEPWFQALRKYIESYDRCLRIIDLTHDLAIPTFAAVSWKQHGKSILFGLGTHLDARIGISRAVTELSQRLSFAERVEQGENAGAGAAEARISKWLLDAHIDAQPHLVPRGDLVRLRKDYDNHQSGDLCDDISLVVRKLAALGIDTTVLDMSKADLPLATARVTAPGLRHFWARFGPGRLYDVPVKLGWLDKPTLEQDLNPIAYFL